MGNVAQQFGVYWPNLIAQVVLFAIVYWVLKRFAFRPVIAMLEERRRRIEEGQLNAENIKKQLAAAQAKYEEILAKANGDTNLPSKMTVSRPSRFKASWYRALAIMGLRRSSVGGFGSFIPETSAAG